MIRGGDSNEPALHTGGTEAGVSIQHLHILPVGEAQGEVLIIKIHAANGVGGVRERDGGAAAGLDLPEGGGRGGEVEVDDLGWGIFKAEAHDAAGQGELQGFDFAGIVVAQDAVHAVILQGVAAADEDEHLLGGEIRWYLGTQGGSTGGGEGGGEQKAAVHGEMGALTTLRRVASFNRGSRRTPKKSLAVRRCPGYFHPKAAV